MCRSRAVAALAALALASAPASAAPASWTPWRHVREVVDLAGPRSDGSFVTAARGRLLALRSDGLLSPLARGSSGYRTATGTEPYIALSSGHEVPGAGCRFRRGAIYALEPGASPGVVEVDGRGRAGRLADLPAGGLPGGIAADDYGRFGYRLLVTEVLGESTRVLAVDCAGGVATIAASAPRVEGGIAVAPRDFGAFGGDLLAPDELSGKIVAIRTDGTSRTVADSGLPTGGDIGVESAGFVPAGFERRFAYLADRGTPGNPHAGTDSVLRLSGRALARRGVRSGDLLVATEAGAHTVAIRCRAACRVREVARGPGVTHAEGHIVFGR